MEKRTPNKRAKFLLLSKEELLLKLEELQNQDKTLDEEINTLLGKGVDCNLQPEMKALQRYNEMKDLAQIVLGHLADLENCTTLELHERFNLPTNE